MRVALCVGDSVFGEGGGVCTRASAEGTRPDVGPALLWLDSGPQRPTCKAGPRVWLEGAAGGLFLLQARPEERVAQARKTPVFWFLRRARLGAVTAGRPGSALRLCPVSEGPPSAERPSLLSLPSCSRF